MRLAPVPIALFALLAGAAGGAQAADPVPACPADADPMHGWNRRAPPRRIFGNTYYVGTCGITSLLVTSPEGDALIDGGTEQAAPLIEANIRALGFRLGDVKYLLNSHEHFDHAGGIAQLQRDTGAQVLAGAPDELALGRNTRRDPQFLELPRFPPVAAVALGRVHDGQAVRIGDLVLTAHATPGHAPGGTSWTWRSCEGAHCLRIAYADSLSPVSDGQYRYSDHPDDVALFRRSIDAVADLPCDVLLTPHPSASGMFGRMDGEEPLADADACRDYARGARSGLDARIAKEKAGIAP